MSSSRSPSSLSIPCLRGCLKNGGWLNFKDFVAFLSGLQSQGVSRAEDRVFVLVMFAVIFKVYDTESKGKVGFKDLLEVLRDLTGSFMSEKQREQVLGHLLEEAGYTRDCSLSLDDFVKILGKSEIKMEVEVPVD
ncbi:uncharacterized protein A4U43_C03F31240 [Asparagus officinalis]|uniref:EF-hand domain-containing protein n=1 Tax=Asparagus officinalis TaxID=4686 RepID=A0A5P1FG62_ASPOF|nr:uncharacterized protein A4U43_C03F31240 [Asparagus officinalis]